jgi:hypothetical protein
MYGGLRTIGVMMDDCRQFTYAYLLCLPNCYFPVLFVGFLFLCDKSCLMHHDIILVTHF